MSREIGDPILYGDDVKIQETDMECLYFHVSDVKSHKELNLNENYNNFNIK